MASFFEKTRTSAPGGRVVQVHLHREVEVLSHDRSRYRFRLKVGLMRPLTQV